MTSDGGKFQVGSDHLVDEVVPTLGWQLDKRISFNWRDRFISHQKTDEIHALIDRLRARPRTLRPQGLLVASVPGNGKTALLQEYARRFAPHKNPEHADQDNETARLLLTATPGNGKTALLQEYAFRHPNYSTPETSIKPVVIALAPVHGGAGKLYSAILKALGYKDWDQGSIDSKQRRLLNALVNCRVELVVIDDVNNWLHGGTSKSEALYAIRNISNCLQIPLVFAGSEEARIVFEEEDSIKTRLDIVELPLWSEGHEYYDFLFNLESTLSLKNASYLWKEEKSHLIMSLSGVLDPYGRRGIIYNILKLVKTATESGLQDGSECIEASHLKAAAEKQRSQWA